MRGEILFAVLMSIIIFTGGLAAQRNGIKMERISIEQGLSQSMVRCILQCSKGFMWFGTQDGLNKYDGCTFKVYNYDRTDPNTLSHKYPTAVIEDHLGMLWVTTFNGGINRFDPENEIFTRFQHQADNPRSLSHNRAMAVFEDRDGVIWVGTENGLNKFDRKKQDFTHFHHDPDDPNSLSHNYVLRICQDSTGTMWIGTVGGGLNKFDVKREIFTHYTHDAHNANSLSHNSISSLCFDKNGMLWIGTHHGGVNKFDTRTEQFTHYKHDPNNPVSLSSNLVECVYIDKSGVLWAATNDKGLNRFNREQETFTHYYHDPNNPHSLSSDFLYCIYEDRSNVMWVGSRTGGVNKFDRKPRKFIHYKYEANDPDSLGGYIVFSIYKDSKGVTWLGTFSGGLNKFNREDETFTRYRHDANDPGSVCDNRIRAICEDNKGRLWVGSPRKGISIFNRETETFTHVKHDPNDPDSLSSNRVNFIYKDREGVLWISMIRNGISKRITADGNSYQTKERFIHYRHDPDNPNSLSSDQARSIYQDRSGTLWVGTFLGGINRFDGKTDHFVRYTHDPRDPTSISSDNIHCIYEDNRGVLWIGTAGGGFNQFDREKEIFINFTEKDGLPNDTVYGILEDNRGHLWLTTNRGLSKFNPQTKSFRSYDFRDGLQSNEFNEISYFKDEKGRMYVGGINGFNIFHPERLEDNPYIPPVVLSSFKIFQKEVKFNTSIDKIKEIDLSYKQNFFSFEFAALDYTNPAKNQYAYKMKGLDKDWIYSGSRRYTNFTNLGPGRYIFQVRGSNNDNIWNNEGTSVIINIHPPPWKTWWFTVISVIFFAVVSYFLINFIKKYSVLLASWKRKNYISHYKVTDKLASGGMGIVYKASDILDRSRSFAIKVLRDEYFTDEIQKKRFKNEASLIDQFNHPNIVKIVERGECGGNLYIVMELLEGQTLSEIIKEEGTLTVETVLNIMTQAADALVKIHNKNIIHRDLKPENIMIISTRQNPHFVKLLDFGLAKTKDFSRLTRTGMILGTIFYLSPEQILDAEISFASDIYSLGILCWEMLAGQNPFDGEAEDFIISRILASYPPELSRFRPDIPETLNRLVMTMISKDPEDRPSAEAVFHKLMEITEENTTDCRTNCHPVQVEANGVGRGCKINRNKL